MTRQQLALIESPARRWRLDDSTRAIGRRGLAEARSALRAAQARSAAPDHTGHAVPAEHAPHADAA